MACGSPRLVACPMSPRWKGRPGGAFSQNETGDCLTVDKQGPREAHDDNAVLIEPSGSHVHPARSGRPARIRVVLQERTITGKTPFPALEGQAPSANSRPALGPERETRAAIVSELPNDANAVSQSHHVSRHTDVPACPVPKPRVCSFAEGGR